MIENAKLLLEYIQTQMEECVQNFEGAIKSEKAKIDKEIENLRELER